jgi:hypothetical protein
MSREIYKANSRRIGTYLYNKVFSGHGANIDSNDDILDKELYTNMKSLHLCNENDWSNNDNLKQYDFVHSSQYLEHISDINTALTNWWGMVKPGGYLIVTVPDEDLYEQGHYPSKYNQDHKWTFSINKSNSWSPVHINVVDLISILDDYDIIKLELVDTNYDYSLQNEDQTLGNAEAFIEFILRKKPLSVAKDKISFVCTTYRRFQCVQRIVAQFNAQTYPNKELIILNTDMEHPYTLGYHDDNIKIINNNIDYISGKPYTNRGQICRDAVTHATGEYFMLADDDDIYLPWHMQQAYDGIKELGTVAWKPQKSLFATREKIDFAQNTMEASIIVKMDKIREYGFNEEKTGYEGLSWYNILRDNGQLSENNSRYVCSYCFNWGDPPELAGHKQSGNIDAPNNFEEHKSASKDIVTGPLYSMSKEQLDTVYQPYFNFIKSHKLGFPQDLYDKYCSLL